MNRIHKTERGFASIAAIFLLVVMAALGGFMLTFSNTQQLTSAQDLKGSQAYWAARAGLEWGMGNVIRQASRTAGCPTLPTTDPPTDHTTLTGFDGDFTVAVTCKMQEYTESYPAPIGIKVIKIFSLTSVANNDPATPGNVGFIERSVSASIEK
jgi:MSHA biogenesis protein MshP